MSPNRKCDSSGQQGHLKAIFGSQALLYYPFLCGVCPTYAPVPQHTGPPCGATQVLASRVPFGGIVAGVIDSASCRGVAQSGSAPALGAGGRWFESSRPDHFQILLNQSFTDTRLAVVQRTT